MNQMIEITQNGLGDVAAVIAIIAQQAMMDDNQIAPDTLLADLNLDSLVMVEIVFALEETFAVTIPFNANATGKTESAFDMSTPAAIAAAIDALRRQ